MKRKMFRIVFSVGVGVAIGILLPLWAMMIVLFCWIAFIEFMHRDSIMKQQQELTERFSLYKDDTKDT